MCHQTLKMYSSHAALLQFCMSRSLFCGVPLAGVYGELLFRTNGPRVKSVMLKKTSVPWDFFRLTFCWFCCSHLLVKMITHISNDLLFYKQERNSVAFPVKNLIVCLQHIWIKTWTLWNLGVFTSSCRTWNLFLSLGLWMVLLCFHGNSLGDDSLRLAGRTDVFIPETRRGGTTLVNPCHPHASVATW